MIDEGYIKFAMDWRRGAPPAAGLCAELNRWRKPLHQAGLIGHYQSLGIGFGNLSMRSPERGHFVISGTQTGDLADLQPRHFALVTDYDIDGNRVCCEGAVPASSESMTHAAIYELNPAINAVVHVHSAPLWARWRNRLPTTDTAIAYGTPAMAAEFRRLYLETAFIDDALAVMGGHEEGIISYGETLAQAARRILALDALPDA